MSRMAFATPRPATYDISLPGLFFVPEESSKMIACIQYPEDLPNRLTLLYSHGNGEDLGGVYGYMVFLSKSLNVNVISYDYTGYGLTTAGGDQPSESAIYDNVETVYAYLISTLRIDTENLFIIGRSLGSGPSIHLAQVTRRGYAGLILLSPILSAISVVSETLAASLAYADIFVNINKISHIGNPILIIHGASDEIVSHEHGVKLSQKCTSGLWKFVTIPGGSHNNEITTHGIETITAIRDFIT